MKLVALVVTTLIACTPKPAPAPPSPAPAPAPAPPPKDDSPKHEADCVCTMQYDPVCGADGKTYSNSCVAACGKIEVKAPGACPK